MFVRKILFYTAVVLALVRCESSEKEHKEDEFVPTHEWQTVKEGQKIPKGLHVRINLQTGLKEAKLLDEDDQPIRDETLGANNMKHAALLEMKPRDSSEDFSRIRPQYKSYKVLKEELGDFVVKTDFEIIRDLLESFKNLTTNDISNMNKALAILEDLEYLAHQFDNAVEFITQNGFKDLILKNLNSTDTGILKGTLKLLGALCQNNAKVQIHALEMGSIPMTSRLLNSHTSHEVRMAAVYALGCLIRRFPLAQKNFINNGGLEIFDRLFDIQDTKLQVKMITLIDDLVTEFYEALKDTNSPDYKEKVRQYTEINLVHKLELNQWCTHLNNALLSLLIEDRYDHDSIEKILKAISNVAETCSSSLIKIVSGLEEQYGELARTETEEDSYFKNMWKLCLDLAVKLSKEESMRTQT